MSANTATPLRRTLRQADGMSIPGGQGNSYQRINPVRERLDRGTLVHDWIPRDIRSQNKIMRTIYLTDPVAGPAQDFYREVPFGPVVLGGIEDEKRLQLYNDALEALNLQRWLPFLAGDLLVVGRLICHLIFDGSRGYYTDMIVHDSDWVKIEPCPILGEEPIIDLLVPPEYRRWATSSDPRAKKARSKLDPRLLKLLAAGSTIPLPPENTIFVPRRASASDQMGTGLAFRILPLVAIEYAYINAEVTGMRRRAGPIMTATMGIEDKWEPTPEEMMALQDMLVATEEDPVGAKLVVRNGIEFNTIGGHTEIAKLSEQWAWLKEAKLQGLGMNEAFATGETSWNYLEAMLSLGMERIRNFRNFIASEVIQHGILEPLARLNEFYKTTPKKSAHHYRMASDKSENNLDIPSIEWTRSLRPSADRDYMEMLGTLEEKGLPVTLRQWAQAGGFDVDEAVKSFDSDLELRKTIKDKWTDPKTKLGGSGGGEEGGEGEGEAEVSESYRKRAMQRVVDLPVWRNGEFGSLRKGAVADLMEKLPNHWNRMTERGWHQLEEKLVQRHHLSIGETNLLRYMLTRSGCIKIPLPPRSIVAARNELLKGINGRSPDRNLMREIYWLNGELSRHNPDDPESVVDKFNQSSSRAMPWLQPAGSDLLTGTVTK